jgi:Deoxyxylulose-5-phosphate synthase
MIENSHASTALSYADGLAKAFALRGEGRHVVAVVGDGALTGGMCWEALNNIAGRANPLVIVVNDNGRSYARPSADWPTPGRAAPQPRVREGARPGQGGAGPHPAGRCAALRGAARGEEGHQGRGRPQAMFEDLGIKYVGPVDGHDIAAVESALRGPSGSAVRSSCTR